LIRIAIVNDVRLAIEVLRRVVASLPNAEVAWIAENGKEAVEKCHADRPDLVLMDLIMPVMDGVEATRCIMQQSPCPILVVTATVTGNSDPVFEALGHGALDAVNTPVLGRDGTITGGDELVRKIRNVVRLCAGRAAGLEVAPPALPDRTLSAPGVAPVLAIGASTGGPQALARVLGGLSSLRDYAVVVVQHLDEIFVPGFVEWLARETKKPVSAAESGERPRNGVVHVACTSDHLVLEPSGRFRYVHEPADLVYRPSVDVFFESLLRARVQPGIALILTGMGRDGAAGMKALHEVGWRTIAQDQTTSIVWGMPGAAVRLQAVDRVLPVNEIDVTIAEWMEAGNPQRARKS
jgi:two-component system response regulator WspF